MVPLYGLHNAALPWLALTIVGPANQLQIIDPTKRKLVHSLVFAKSHNGGIESMAWDEKAQRLYIVTAKYLYVWDSTTPDSTTFLGEVPEATSLYDITLDSLGNVWGGTYPSGTVFSYMPRTKEITTYSRVAEDTDYVRRLAIDEQDRVWVGTGSQNPRVFSFATSNPEERTEIPLPQPMDEGFISRLDVHGNYLVASASNVTEQMLLNRETKSWDKKIDRVWSARQSSWSEQDSTSRFYTLTKGELYRTSTDSWTDTKLGTVNADSPLALLALNSHVLVVSATADGVQVEFFDLRTKRVQRTASIDLASGEFTVQSLLGHSNGNIYIGGYMGSGLAAINPDTGQRWSSPDQQNVVNQIEGMIEFDAEHLYIGSYGSADIISVDFPNRDTPQAYERLVRLSRQYQQSRPFGWAKNSRNVFFGTVPDYGLAGGVIGMIDPHSDSVEWVLDGGGQGFIKAQSIIGLAADEKYLYGVSSVRNGYGIPDTEGLAHVFKVEIATRKVVWQSTPIPNAGALYSPTLIAGWLVVADMEGIAVIDPQNGKLLKKHQLTPISNEGRRPGWANADIARIGEGTQVVHSAHGTATLVDFVDGTIANIADPKEKLRFGARLAVGPTGRVFGSMGQTTVVEFDLTPAQPTTESATPSTSRPPKT